MRYMDNACERSAAPRAQSGVTITMVIVFGFILMAVVYLFLKTGPLVLERYKVDGLMKTLTESKESGKMSADGFYANLIRQLDLQGVTRFNPIKAGEFMKINFPRKKSDKKSVTFFYSASEKLYGEIFITLNFNQTYIFGGGEKQ